MQPPKIPRFWQRLYSQVPITAFLTGVAFYFWLIPEDSGLTFVRDLLIASLIAPFLHFAFENHYSEDRSLRPSGIGYILKHHATFSIQVFATGLLIYSWPSWQSIVFLALSALLILVVIGKKYYYQTILADKRIQFLTEMQFNLTSICLLSAVWSFVYTRLAPDLNWFFQLMIIFFLAIFAFLIIGDGISLLIQRNREQQSDRLKRRKVYEFNHLTTEYQPVWIADYEASLAVYLSHRPGYFTITLSPDHSYTRAFDIPFNTPLLKWIGLEKGTLRIDLTLIDVIIKDDHIESVKILVENYQESKNCTAVQPA